ncbi:helicase ComFA [Streptococcus pneumoniae]|nr:helicase ComFA [Streptococcus pneumoniae]
MIYQVVAKVINAGGAVCLASPRIDVCLELYKRLQQDFSCGIALLHGESEPYFRTPLVVATTHQLLKFYQAFDLLIVDEVDAFPYVDNPMLYHAVKNSVKENGLRIFLTATSTNELDKKVRLGELKRLNLPRRFHGNPLIIPKPIWLSDFNRYLDKNRLSPKLKSYIEKQRKTAYPLLIFASEIKKGEQLAEILQEQFPNEKIGFVSSVTEDRLEQVQAFRDGELTILISTTILERGVTFPCVDVFVVEANHRLFTKSSLIQIGGRVGRSMDRPTGDLLFFHDGLNASIKKAIKEIQMMNKEAGL